MKIIAVVNQLYTNTYDTLYYEAKKNSDIEWTFVLIPFDYLTTHVSVENLEEMMNKKGYSYIVGYKDGEYLDLKQFKPDLVLIQTPYDSAYGSSLYQTPYLSTFCAVASVSYGASMISFEGDYYRSWMDKTQNIKNLWKNFNETNVTRNIINECYSNHSINTGYVKCDKYINYKGNNDFKIKEKNDKFTVVWKPRWLGTVGESSFLKYIYYFMYFCKKHPEIHFIFLLHQNLEGYLKHRKIMMPNEFQEILSEFEHLSNTEIIMNEDFLDDVMNADLYIGDYSSTVVEFALTAKPLIYTPCDVILNEIGEKIYESSYVCENIEQIETTILNIYNGKDEKQSLRNQLREFLLIDTPKEQTYAQNLLKYILDHEEEIKNFPKSCKGQRKKMCVGISRKMKIKLDLSLNAFLLILSCFPILSAFIKRRKVLAKLNSYIRRYMTDY